MVFLAKFFWLLLPITLLTGFVRETDFPVARIWALSSHSTEAFDTYKDLGGVATVVAIYFKNTQKLPGNLPKFLEEYRKNVAGRSRKVYEDAWNNPYRLVDLGEKYKIMSCGPDRDCATETDNLFEVVRKVKPDPNDPQTQQMNKLQKETSDRTEKIMQQLEQLK